MKEMSFEEYCEDILGLHIGLLNSKELDEVKQGFQNFTNNKTKRETINPNALKKRKIAKDFGGKALKGTKRQKEWAEEIRSNIIQSGKLTSEEISKLLNVGGFTEYAAFWIENKDVLPGKFIAENIVKQYRGLREIENKHAYFLNHNNPTVEKEKLKTEIRNYLASCDFKFKSFFV